MASYLLTFFSYKNIHFTDENLIEIEEQLNALNEFYKRALLYEFDLNLRDENFMKRFEQVQTYFLLGVFKIMYLD